MTARLLRVVGGLLLATGGLTFAGGLVALSIEHPGLDSRLLLVPFAGIALTGLGMGLTLDWRHWDAEPRGWGAYLVAAGALTVIPLVGILGIALWLIGTPLLAARLIAGRIHPVTGWALLVGSVAFIVTRPWILGAVQTGDALAAQELVERTIAVILGAGWVLLGLVEAGGTVASAER